jgi:hypothetical protein
MFHCHVLEPQGSSMMAVVRVARAPGMLTRIALVFAVGVLVNYPWELAQSPLYGAMGDFQAVLRHCFVAAIGDGVLVLAVFAAGAIVLRRTDWFVQPGTRGYAVMLAAGLLIGLLVEWLGINIARRWAYAPSMPLIPGINIGIVPVMQMLVLPPLCFRIVAATLARYGRPG